jgi:3-hydroxyisobutyrate dehydrogenase
MKIGFIGTGSMGSGMALRLCQAGYAVTVHDLRKESAQEILAAGARWANAVPELARESDVVFTSLPGPREMQELALSDEGLLSHMRSGTTWFDLTTNSPSVVREICKKAADKGITLIDAPVSGGVTGARSGKLALYIGGNQAVFERHRKLLESIGDRVIYVGDIGAGGVAKIVHNLISLVSRMVIAEGMSLGIKAGIAPVQLWGAVRQGAIGRARTLDLVAEQYLQSSYDPTFTLRLAYKDFRLAMDLAEELGVPMKQSQAAELDYIAALERGWAEKDCRIAMMVQNERVGIELRAELEDIRSMMARS